MSSVLAPYSARVDQQLQLRLEEYCAGHNDIELLEAIRYALFNGGKRIRPALVYASAELLGLTQQADSIACAIELMHSYSLIHDDLPAMDDDDVRRGKPSCHVQHGEAIAILAGDAMQALAFQFLLKDPENSDACKVKLCQALAESVGVAGMAGGQAMDILLGEEQQEHHYDIETIHRLKTGALMGACITMPLCCADDVEPEMRESLRAYADDIGLCFQIKDDILDDMSATTASSAERVSYIYTHGREASQEKLRETSERCIEHLHALGPEAQALLDITNYIVTRDV